MDNQMRMGCFRDRTVHITCNKGSLSQRRTIQSVDGQRQRWTETEDPECGWTETEANHGMDRDRGGRRGEPSRVWRTFLRASTRSLHTVSDIDSDDSKRTTRCKLAKGCKLAVPRRLRRTSHNRRGTKLFGTTTVDSATAHRRRRRPCPV